MFRLRVRDFHSNLQNSNKASYYPHLSNPLQPSLVCILHVLSMLKISSSGNIFWNKKSPTYLCGNW